LLDIISVLDIRNSLKDSEYIEDDIDHSLLPNIIGISLYNNVESVLLEPCDAQLVFSNFEVASYVVKKYKIYNSYVELIFIDSTSLLVI
jgi:hypothetical protein